MMDDLGGCILQKPRNIRLINVLMYLKIALLLPAIIIPFMILVLPDNAWASWAEFKRKQLEHAGLTEFTANDFGITLLNISIPMLIMVALILFVRFRKYFPAIASGIFLVSMFSFDQIQLVLALAVVVLLFTPSVRRYFKGDVMISSAPAARPVRPVAAGADDGQAEVDGEVAAVEVLEPRARPKMDVETSIRQADANDAETVYTLMMMAFEEYRSAIPPSSALSETAEGIEEALANGSESAAILYEDDVAVAAVRYRLEADVLHFFRLSVIPSKRRRGYAKQLVKWLEHYGISKGMNVIRCKVRQSVQNNLAMYQNMGYEVVDQALDVRPEGSVKIITLEKSLRL